MPLFQPYQGFATIAKLDYGHPKPEFSLILVPDNWSDLVGLLAVPYELLRKARQTFTIDPSAQDHYWDVYGPLTIILDPLTVPSRSSAEALRIIALAVEKRGSHFDGMAAAIRALIPQWQSIGHDSWRTTLINSCAPSRDNAKILCPGFFLVEYALITRVMVVRYIPPAVPAPYFVDNITPITFSDFLVDLHVGTTTDPPNPREAFMHFDLKSATDPAYTSENVAIMKAQFAVDYITSPTETLKGVAELANGRIDKSGNIMPDYHYTAAKFGRNGQVTKPVGVQTPTDATGINMGLISTPLLSNGGQPLFERINGDYDPTVILESVDPWASDWIWKHVPGQIPYNIDGRFPIDVSIPQEPLNSGDDEVPQPCALIYVTLHNGTGQWVIDPSSLLLKNYYAPTVP